MQTNTISTFKDHAVETLVSGYYGLDLSQIQSFQQSLLNAPEEFPTENLSIKMPTTWQDIADMIGLIEWAWPGWVAKGFLTIVAGESSKGKSTLALRIAACYINSQQWPGNYEPNPIAATIRNDKMIPDEEIRAIKNAVPGDLGRETGPAMENAPSLLEDTL
jgi:hypothetical protein